MDAEIVANIITGGGGSKLKALLGINTILEVLVEEVIYQSVNQQAFLELIYYTQHNWQKWCWVNVLFYDFQCSI